MPLIQLIQKEDASPEVRAIYERGEGVYGKVLETWKAVAHNPRAFQHYMGYLGGVAGPGGALDQRVKQLTAVRICLLNHCRYSTSHRYASSLKDGVPAEDLLALVDPESHDFSPRERAALRFADELTLNMIRPIAENPQGVSAATLAALKEHFDDPEIAELALSASLWNALTRFHRVMDFDLDMPPPPPALDDAL